MFGVPLNNLNAAGIVGVGEEGNDVEEDCVVYKRETVFLRVDRTGLIHAVSVWYNMHMLPQSLPLLPSSPIAGEAIGCGGSVTDDNIICTGPANGGRETDTNGKLIINIIYIAIVLPCR